jgi:hypothetical protein
MPPWLGGILLYLLLGLLGVFVLARFVLGRPKTIGDWRGALMALLLWPIVWAVIWIAPAGCARARAKLLAEREKKRTEA